MKEDEITEEQVYQNIGEALKEVKLIEESKLSRKTLTDLISELKSDKSKNK